ncbi:peptidylprolyl isomerase [Curtobacterium ammoniigenes]|uniref:peptidylprolyl isomerase n=1 Tax=Curtobacterium ammoniigenes TaxID=395387 RepID=UPI0008354973|nr:peptidylprolyl isomerase [Curtobacterium ammoniigenes]
MASKNQSRQSREARERLRLYEARQGLFETQRRRRLRDNIIAGIALIVIAALATGSQLVHGHRAQIAARAAASASASASAAATASASASPSASPAGDVGSVPSKSIAQNAVWNGTITLNKTVTLGIQLDGAAAPQAASVEIDLIQKNFYTGTTCHRLANAANFKFLQCGSANGDGTGDAGFQYGPVENAPANGVYPTGTIAIARGSSLYSQTTQFFIVYGTTQLDASSGGYTVVGKVTSGLPQLEAQITSKGIANPGADGTGEPKVATTITGASIHKG